MQPPKLDPLGSSSMSFKRKSMGFPGHDSAAVKRASISSQIVELKDMGDYTDQASVDSLFCLKFVSMFVCLFVCLFVRWFCIVALI